MMLTKVLTGSFKHSRKNTHTVCYTLLHIIEIGLIIGAIKVLVRLFPFSTVSLKGRFCQG
jgi:hypothetical protein